MTFIYLALMIMSTITTGVAMWHDDWPKATFYLIVTLIWFHQIEHNYPLKKEK